jgi:hypothetical protein
VALIDIRRFHDGNDNSLVQSEDKGIQNRRAMSLLNLSQCLFHPTGLGIGRGAQSFIPDHHQLLALDAFLKPWLSNLFGEEATPRKTIILADEGGMGKTYSSVIVALKLLEKGGSVIVLCPPLLKNDWAKAFRAANRHDVYLRSARCLNDLNGNNLKDGITIISKHSLLRHEMDFETCDELNKKVELCIIDEGHEGMITGNDDDVDKKLRESISVVSKACKRRLIATATPMQNNYKDLAKLILESISDSNDIILFKEWINHKFDNNLLNEIGEKWLPAVEKIREGTLTDNDIDYISSRAREIIPWVTASQADMLEQKLPKLLKDSSSMEDDKKSRIARDLHPFGKYMSICLRDDLGEEKANLLYRKQESEVKIIDQWNELDEAIEYIKENRICKKKSNWNAIFRSNPRNIFDKRYSKSFPRIIDLKTDEKIHIDELVEKTIQNDKRFDYLEQICENIERNQKNSREKMGIVIFCNYNGTISRLEKWGKGKNYDVITLNENEENFKNQSIETERADHRYKESQLEKADVSSEDRDKVTMLICGKDASIGLNMSWATNAVHWDIEYGAVEKIVQKTWRLDRRWDGNPRLMQDFLVTYMIFSDRLKDAEKANEVYRNNRLILGNRKYIGSNLSPPIFGIENGSVLPNQKQKWTVENRKHGLSSDSTKDFWKWCNGEKKDIAGIAEELGLKSLELILGIDFQNIFENEYNNDLESLGINFSQLHDLICLASPKERASLQYISGGVKNVKTPISTYGIPNIQDDKELLRILPNGELVKKISKFYRNLYENKEIPMQVYPFYHYDDGEIAYGIHLGIMDLLNGPLKEIAVKLNGPGMPSGLIIREGRGEWRHILVNELQNHESFFNQLNEYSTIDYYRDLLPDRDLDEDRDTFLKMEDYRKTLEDGIIDERGFDVGAAELIKFLRDIKKMREMNKSDFIPIGVIQEKESSNPLEIRNLSGKWAESKYTGWC